MQKRNPVPSVPERPLAEELLESVERMLDHVRSMQTLLLDQQADSEAGVRP